MLQRDRFARIFVASVLLAASVSALTGCSDDSGSPAAAPDGGVDLPDAGLEPGDGGVTPELDGGPPDAGPPDTPATALCEPCPEAGCGGGALCLTNQRTMESFCGAPCDDNEDCPRGANCVSVGDGVSQCAPATGSCASWPPSDLGAPCENDDGCQVEAERCAEANDRDYCTLACASDDDCPVGFARCADGLCRADWEEGPHGCGRRADTALVSCAGGCSDGLSCVDALLDGDLSPTVAPFCTRSCTSDDECPSNARCRPVGGEASVCLDESCDCLARPPGEALLDEAYALAGLDRCEASFDPADLERFAANLSRDAFRLSYFNRAHASAHAGVRWARGVHADLAIEGQREQPLAAIIEAAAGLLDTPLTSTPSTFEAPPETPLVTALRGVWLAADQGSRFDAGAVTESLAALPESLRPKLARVIAAATAAASERESMLRGAGVSPDLASDLFDLVPGFIATRGDFRSLAFAQPRVAGLLNGDLDLTGLFGAARDLAVLVESIDWSEEAGAMGFDVFLDTPLGRISITDGGESTIEGRGTYLLVYDAGGNDRYEIGAGATRSFRRPVAVAIEVGGDDHYGYAGSDDDPEVEGLPPADDAGRYAGDVEGVGDTFGPMSLSSSPRQGAGILGVGLHFDLAGNDDYRSLKLSQGAGVLGVGALVDRAGDDDYGCEQGCQGASAFGIGVLLDGAGADTYAGAQFVQGAAYVRGFAHLQDRSGDDRYQALLGDAELGGTAIYPSAQNPGASNTSMAQGAGMGRRGDNDGAYASGGLGVLIDGDGEDEYVVDIFGQGSGFWFGTGLFADDGDGDDVYYGRYYNQASGAHYAMSFFFEAGGNDRYNEVGGIIATAVGQGHDFSLGAFVDFGGNDSYVAPGLGLGAGNDNGIGLFLELGGNDSYQVPDARTFGGANIGDRGEVFEGALCLGVFVDAGGEDDYGDLEGAGPIGEDATWRWSERREGRPAGERGAGIDRSDASLDLEAPVSEARAGD